MEEEEEEEDKEKQQCCIRSSKYTSGIVVSQQDKVPQARPKKRRKNTAVTFLAFQKATGPYWMKWHLKKSIIGFNATAALQGSWFKLRKHCSLTHRGAVQLCGPHQPNCSWVMVRCREEAHLADLSPTLSGNVLPFTNDILKQHCWNPAVHIKTLRLSFPLCFP